MICKAWSTARSFLRFAGSIRATTVRVFMSTGRFSPLGPRRIVLQPLLDSKHSTKIVMPESIQTSPNIDLLIQIAHFATIIIGMLIVAGAVVTIVSVLKAPELLSKVALALVRSNGVIQTITILVIVTSVVVLRVLDKVSAEASMIALTGIAGYILGGVQSALFHPRGASDHSPPQSD